jgi:hypothetical protein
VAVHDTGLAQVDKDVAQVFGRDVLGLGDVVAFQPCWLGCG